MADFKKCPKCGRNAKNSFSSNHFPVYKCTDCGQEYCKECGGRACPKCGSSKFREVGKVYA